MATRHACLALQVIKWVSLPNLKMRGIKLVTSPTYLMFAHDLKAWTSSILLLWASVLSCNEFKFLYRFLCSFRKACLYFHLSQ